MMSGTSIIAKFSMSLSVFVPLTTEPRKKVCYFSKQMKCHKTWVNSVADI